MVPIFFLLVFAVIEYSLINSAIGAYNFAAKDAARYGAIAGPTQANADTKMLNAILSHVSGVVAAVPVEVDVFQATESGTFPGTGLMDQYFYNGGSSWTTGTLTWRPPPSTDCGGAGCRDDRLVSQDYLGIHIIYHYTYVTAFFSSVGATITLTADSVQRIEPQELFHHAPATGAAIITAQAAAPPDAPLRGALTLLAIAPACLYRPSRNGVDTRRGRGRLRRLVWGFWRMTLDRKERRV